MAQGQHPADRRGQSPAQERSLWGANLEKGRPGQGIARGERPSEANKGEGAGERHPAQAAHRVGGEAHGGQPDPPNPDSEGDQELGPGLESGVLHPGRVSGLLACCCE